MRWILHKVAKGVAQYPKTSLGLVITYVVGSTLELFPPFEVISDFIVILSYLLILRYIKTNRSAVNNLK